MTKKQKGGVGSGEWSAHSYTDLPNVCMSMQAFTTRITQTHTCTDKFTQEYTFTRPSSLIHACFPCKYTHLTHINRYLRIYIISSWSPHTHSCTRTPQLSSISGFRAVPPLSPWLCFWLCLHAGRRSPDTHRWVSSLHINATSSPIKNPICAFIPFPQHRRVLL